MKINVEIECSPDEPFMMQPGDFALASTVESLELPDDLLGRLEGRSSTTGVGVRRHRCNPHSVLARPAQRPDLGSSPAATGFVHGSQPIEG